MFNKDLDENESKIVNEFITKLFEIGICYLTKKEDLI